ncbi:DUF4181 domain-containing protein [Paenisporosarcina indica]|uniref:DUF4181 domain-containing protein n=1 Tax=Paenisporosarcina indica TaxID=650093 RepID=UPI00094FD7B4|nr:DUF4181 domain-containing protein [Paenisporosarcina indica]
MFLVKFIIVLVIVGLIMTAIEMGIRKVFKIDKRDKKRSRYMNKFHRWGEIILLVVMVISYSLFSSQFPESKWLQVWIILFFLILELFRAGMEWKFAAQKREYIIHLFFCLVLLVFAIIAFKTMWLEQIFGF